MEFKSYFSGSSGNLYQLKGTSGNLLIEAGVPIAKIKKALNFKLNSISACLISHQHLDHAKAVKDVAKAGIDCFMLKETAQALKFNGHRLRLIEPLRQFEIGPYSIIPIPIHHQDVRTGERIPGVGFLISDGAEKLLFYLDSFYCKYRFQGLTQIALGVNYSKKTLDPDLNSTRKKRLFKSHLSLENAIKMIQSMDTSKLKAIYVLHVSETNGDKNYFKDVLQRKFGKPVYI